MLESGKRLQVYSIKQLQGERTDGKTDVWTKAGSAWVNRDGSMNLYLDVLPINGRLHVREAPDKRDIASSAVESALGNTMEAH